MPPGKRVHVGVGALIHLPQTHPQHSEGGLLMMRRAGGVGPISGGSDTWCIPGGWLDDGEDPEQTAERETFEETGVTVRAMRRLPYLITHADRTIVTLYIECAYVSGTPTVVEPSKGVDVGWLTWPQILDGRVLYDPLQRWLDERHITIPQPTR